MKRFAACFLVAGMALTLLSGCLKDTGDSDTVYPSYISLMHMAPMSATVDVYFNDNKVSQSVQPVMYFTQYSAVTAGEFSVTFKDASDDSEIASIPTVKYDSLNFYTLLLYNTASGETGAVRIHDDYSNITTSYAYMRFFHMSPNTPEVNVFIDTLEVFSNREVSDNVNSTYYNTFVPVSTGTHTVTVKDATTDATLISISGVSLAAANAYTLLLDGLTNGTGSSALDIDLVRSSY